MNSAVEESLFLQIGNFLVAQGYATASCVGQALDWGSALPSGEIGVLYADPSVDPKKRLFGLITETPRRIFLGVIWFDDSIRNATPRRMLVECYGRDYSNRMSVLAEDLSRKFGTSVSCRLVSEDAQEELFISDNEP